MMRPDAMDRDVAALFGLDADMFARPAKAPPPTRKPARVPGAARPARKRATAQQSPWLWAIVPLAAALVAGVGLTWRSGDTETASSTVAEPPAETATRPGPPELRMGDSTRAMSLKIIDGPRRPDGAARAAQRAPQNIPMSELGPSPGQIAAVQAMESAQAAPPAPQAPAKGPEPVLGEAMALFSDQELAPVIAVEPAAPQP